MAVNRFFQRTPYDIGLYVPPIGAVAETLKIQQQKYDTGELYADTIKNNFIQSLPQDRAEANRIQEGWNKRVDDVVAKHGGNYANANKDINGLLKEIRKEYNPGGKVNAITTNYGTYQEWLTRHRERVEKGNVLGQDLNLANNYFMNNYTGVGEIDPVAGTYNRFNAEDLSDYTDAEAIIQKTYAGFKPEKWKQGVTTLKNGIFNYQEDEFEGIKAQRLAPSFQAALMNDPKYASYLGQKAKFMGAPPEAAAQLINGYAGQRAQDLSYMNQSSINKMERDPYYVTMAKAKADKENMQMFSQLQYGAGTGADVSLQHPDINYDNWQGENQGFGADIMDFLTGSLAKGAATLAGVPTLGIPAAKAWKDYRMDYASKDQKYVPEFVENAFQWLAGSPAVTGGDANLGQFKDDPKGRQRLMGRNVDPILLDKMFEEKKAQYGSDFTQRYGKDPKWTKQFEKDVWYDYGRELPNHSAYQTLELDIPAPAQKNLRQQILPEILAGNAAFYLPGKGDIHRTGASGENIGKFLKTFVEKGDGSLGDLDAIKIKYVLPGPGYAKAGYKVSTPEGEFVVVDQNVQRSEWSKMMENGLGPIFQGGMYQGQQSIAGYDAGSGRAMIGTPRVQLERSLDGKKLDRNIYWDLGDGQTIKKNLPQYYDEMAPLFQQSLGYGMTSGNSTMFDYFNYNMSQQ